MLSRSFWPDPAGAGQSPPDLNSAQPRLGSVEPRHGALEVRDLEPRVEAPLTGDPDNDRVIGRFECAGEFCLTVRAKCIEPDDARIGPQGRDPPDRAVQTRKGNIAQQVRDLGVRAGSQAKIGKHRAVLVPGVRRIRVDRGEVRGSPQRHLPARSAARGLQSLARWLPCRRTAGRRATQSPEESRPTPAPARVAVSTSSWPPR